MIDIQILLTPSTTTWISYSGSITTSSMAFFLAFYRQNHTLKGCAQ